MNNKNIWNISFFHLVLISAVNYGWLCAIPLMIPHLENTTGNTFLFFKLILLSTFIGILTNLFFGRMVDKTSSRIVVIIGLFLNTAFWIIFSL